jgi:peroxiredoxin
VLTRADDLAAMTVLDAAGKPVEVGSLWRDRTAVLVFLRHFGCLHCRDHVAQLGRELDTIHDKQAELFVIGNGSPSFIEGFRDQTGWTGAVYTDPSLAVYKVAQLKRGVASTLDPRSLGDAWRALRGGSRQGRTQGDQWQQGGTLVVAPGGEVRYHHASDRPGDNSRPAQIIAALA